MADRIRPAVWLAGAVPIGLVVAGVVALVAMPHKAPPRAAPSATEPEPSASPEVAALPPRGVPPADTHPPPVLVTSSVTAATPPSVSSAELLRGPPPEPIPGLDALYTRPRGSEQWTTEEKLAYRRQLLDNLDTKERSLRSEIARARQSGDSRTAQEKQATLAYLEASRAQFEGMVQGHDTLREAGS